MKKYILIFSFCFVYSFGQKQNETYQFSLDLTKVDDDKLIVNLITPKIKSENINYHFPKIIPGIYADYDYGRYVSGFTALDKKGRVLNVVKIDDNTYKIENARKLHSIKYAVDDTWDSREIEGNYIVEPAGTNFEENNVFVLNNHCVFGYFDQMQRREYNLLITKPEGFYGSTSLISSNVGNTDRFEISDYYALVDAPIMYNIPDTTEIEVGGAKILISIYSPGKKIHSAEIAEKIKPLLNAQKEYLGGTLPIKKYCFIIFLSDKMNQAKYNGALEHSHSSFYFMPESTADELADELNSIAAHEFFHIVTPLNIHSEQINDFDFNAPNMSKHLWLYEGMTEYAAGHMQVKSGIITVPEYLQIIQSKISNSRNVYNDSLPFTEMSSGVLLNAYKDEYLNVYQKGALIGLCLDIELRRLSNGKYGTQDLMADLSVKYGKNIPFKDEELFDTIAAVTGFAEIREFFRKYVEGTEPLPLKEILKSVGIDYQMPTRTKTIGMGFSSSNLNLNMETGRIFLMNEKGIDAFGKALGYKPLDELVSINGYSLAYTDLKLSRKLFLETTKSGDSVKAVVMRKSGNTFEKYELSSNAFAVENEQKHLLSPIEKPDPSQIQLQKWWIGHKHK